MRANDRRGVLILVVLSLLIMFVVVAVMYVTVATRARSVSTNFAQVERTGDTPEQVVDALARDVFRGSLNPHSPLTTTNLLIDMYGGSIRGQVIQNPPVSQVPATTQAGQGTLMRLSATLTNPPSSYVVTDFFGGCVLTLISGNNKGVSFRVLHSNEAANTNGTIQFTVMPIAAEQSQGSTAAILFANNPVFVINGHPYSGTGAGFNQDSADNMGPGAGKGPLGAFWAYQTGGAQPAEFPYALLPNPAFFEANAALNYNDPAGPGGVNEDYDAPDYQNPHLAFFASGAQNMENIKPSFHDPALLAYWQTWWLGQGTYTGSLFGTSTDPLAAILARKVMFRPNRYDHPTFVDSGPRDAQGNTLWQNLEAGNWNAGPWDVDNDGDGVPDSVWIDPAHPVQVTKDGRTYKTLVAYLVIDLDGRLNLNAHGTIHPVDSTIGTPASFDAPIELASMTFRQPNQPQPNQQMPIPVRYAGQGATNAPTPLTRGSGYGPAEIRLDRIFRPNYIGEYRNLLNGGTFNGANVPGRYGLDYIHKWNGNTLGPATANRAPGYVGEDVASRLRQWDFPHDYRNSAPSSFGSPPDLRGRVAMGLDIGGQPLMHAYRAVAHDTDTNFYNSDWNYEKVDDPYELNLNDMAGRLGWTTMPQAPLPAPAAGTPFVPDTPFSIQEMERLLRPFDIDSQTLPSRIVQLAPSIFQQGLRNLVTTHSFDLPVLSPQAPPSVRALLANNSPPTSNSIIDIVNARVTNGGGQVDTAIQTMLAPELRRGLKMDINRPFGNGADDDNDGAVDDPTEPNQTANYENFSSNNTPVPLDMAYGTGGDGRQLFARHLYILMMLLSDDQYIYLPFGLEVNDFVRDLPKKAELRAHRLAQWAVNVVDFRDQDNIMTRFEYDTTPFDQGGWQPDRVVYGCEMPVLLITETLAFHSRRVVDSAHDDGEGQKRDEMAGDMMTMGENDLDQALIPRGSAFVELLAIFNPNLSQQAQDLFVNAGGAANPDWKLFLQKMAPDGSPVWRLAVTEFHTEQGMNPEDRVTTIVDAHMDTVSFEPTNPGLPPTSFTVLPDHHPHEVRIDRYVYFTNTPPTGLGYDLDHLNRTYHAVNTIGAPGSGEYVVIGPGGFGAGARQAALSVGGKNGTNPHAASDQTLRMAGAFLARNTHRYQAPVPYQDYPNAQSQIRVPIAIPIASIANIPVASAAINVNGAPSAWAPGDRVGFSISEPLFSQNYYPKPTEVNPGTGLREAYGTLDESDPAKKFIDEPLDARDNLDMPLSETTPPRDFRGRRNDEDNLLTTGTYTNVRTVFLQRLADPTQGYDPTSNPYITVDWLPIDLTVFNGEAKWDENQTDYAADEWDPDDRDPEAEDTNGVNFVSRQRGDLMSYTDAPTGIGGENTDYNVWRPISRGPFEIGPNWKTTGNANPPASMDDTHYFRHKLRHSLGYLNQSYGHPMTTQDVQASTNAMQSDNARNYRGWPKAHNANAGKPFPWIKWNNRPFASVHELLDVPSSTPGRLCYEFNHTTLAHPDPMRVTTGSYEIGQNAQQRREFRHLLNFFHSRNDDNPAPDESADLFCVLDFLHVPSRFVGTETVLNPNVYSETNAPAGNETALFRPPYNLISNYRDPGRINLNTINSEAVWNAVMPYKDDGSGPAVSWDDFQISRRGDATITNPLAPVTRGGATLPTIMRNPFRSGASADLVPSTGNLVQLRHQGINATILRAAGENPDDPPQAGGQKVPLFATTTSDTNTADPAYRNNSRNSAFRYQNIERLSNLVTTRSNVYAVWVTVGYFEAIPNVGGIDAGHPDGYQIGAELGSETGDVKRHRGFYIFDRSIPVGFERGMNHNIDRAIILKRFIE
jgi:hypothetical protein